VLRICGCDGYNPAMANGSKPPLEIRIGEPLRARNWMLATAESCTGGLIADRITDIPGSSDYFAGGVVAYANEVKMGSLGVSEAALVEYGAVSRAVVLEMARGACKLLNAQMAVSVSGIAGPGGAVPGKPVGTTWIGLAVPDGAWARWFCWEGDRRQNKIFSAEAALQMVLNYLDGERKLDNTPSEKA